MKKNQKNQKRQKNKTMLKKYIRNILISIDQLVNTILGGDPDWTISSRLGRNYPGTWMAKFVDWLFAWQGYENGHVDNAQKWETDDGSEAIFSMNKNDKNKA